MRRFVFSVVIVLFACMAFAEEAKVQSVLLPESTKKALQDAHKPLDDLQKKADDLNAEFKGLQTRATAVQEEFKKLQEQQPLLQRKYDAVLEQAFKNAGLDKVEEKWDVDLKAGTFMPKGQTPVPAPAPAK